MKIVGLLSLELYAENYDDKEEVLYDMVAEIYASTVFLAFLSVCLSVHLFSSVIFCKIISLEN